MAALIDDCASPRDPEHCADLARRFVAYFVLERGFAVEEADLEDDVIQLHLQLEPPRLILDRRSPLDDRFWALNQAMHYLSIGPEACPSAAYDHRPPLTLVT